MLTFSVFRTTKTDNLKMFLILCLLWVSLIFTPGLLKNDQEKLFENEPRLTSHKHQIKCYTYNLNSSLQPAIVSVISQR